MIANVPISIQLYIDFDYEINRKKTKFWIYVVEFQFITIIYQCPLHSSNILSIRQLKPINVYESALSAMFHRLTLYTLNYATNFILFRYVKRHLHQHIYRNRIKTLNTFHTHSHTLPRTYTHENVYEFSLLDISIWLLLLGSMM